MAKKSAKNQLNSFIQPLIISRQSHQMISIVSTKQQVKQIKSKPKQFKVILNFQKRNIQNFRAFIYFCQMTHSFNRLISNFFI